MAGPLMPVPRQQFIDGNGDPYASGHLHFYVTGTSTPATVYADDDLTTPLANPVVLDSAGRAPAIYLGAQAYKVVLEDSDGNVIWTTDPVADFGQIFVNATTYQPAFTTGTAAPVAGTHTLGEIVWNSEPAATEYVGWICVSAGTPGVWKGFGAIEA